MVPSSRGFNLVRNEVARLQGVRHSAGTHANAIADADRPELVANEVRIV
jgi:hypothetical protein